MNEPEPRRAGRRTARPRAGQGSRGPPRRRRGPPGPPGRATSPCRSRRAPRPRTGRGRARRGAPRGRGGGRPPGALRARRFLPGSSAGPPRRPDHGPRTHRAPRGRLGQRLHPQPRVPPGPPGVALPARVPGESSAIRSQAVRASPSRPPANATEASHEATIVRTCGSSPWPTSRVISSSWSAHGLAAEGPKPDIGPEEDRPFQAPRTPRRARPRARRGPKASPRSEWRYRRRW